MHLDSFVLEALDRVLSWELPDEACSEAVALEVAHLAGVSADDVEQLH